MTTPINKVLKIREILDEPFKDTSLSPREQEAAFLALQGKTDLVITMEMELALGTVKTLLWRGRQKLGVSRPELGWWVLKRIQEVLK